MKAVAFFAAVLLAASTAAALTPPDPLRTPSVDLAYNLDFDAALTSARKAVAENPDDPASHMAVASVIWVRMLFLRGGLMVDEYLGPPTLSDLSRTPPPAALADELIGALDRAVSLADARLKQRPNDLDALYVLGAATGRQAAYTATEEGRLMRAFLASRRAYDAHERLLAMAPSRVDAGLVVGSYRYLVATLSRFMRWMAYLAGFGGDKAKALELIERCARGSHGDAATEARFALLIVYGREGRHDDSLRELAVLRQQYPDNRLLRLETGATLLRAGRPRDAIPWLDEGIAKLPADPRPRTPGEEAQWHLKRGTAHAQLGAAAEARANARAAAALPAANWVRGRISTLEGQAADLEGRRPDAIAAYRRARDLCRTGNDPLGVQEAERGIDKPFRGTSAVPARQNR